jgi:indolepyruvate ferredoxin oxidoreductase beta subunit
VTADGVKKPVDILIVGVGGQGVLLASEILAGAATLSGFEVKKSEVHGMAQRGGSVVSHLRFGRSVRSPLISKGKADYLVSFEKLETLRYLDYLHPGSWALVNDQEIYPLPVSIGKADYPRSVEAAIRGAGLRCKVIDGLTLAGRAGNAKAVNAVILGVLSKFLSFDEEVWKKALEQQLPERHREVNLKAFSLGKRRRITAR